jgi:Transcription factor zinc-finger
MDTASPTMLATAPQSLRACPQCSDPMATLVLASRSPRPVVVDHCARCRLVWFDPLESVNLAGLGWVSLLRTLQQGTAAAPPSAPGRLQCPECRSPLKAVHNQTRFGRFPALECQHGHGHLHSQSGLLAERGLVRPVLPLDRRTLAEEGRSLACLQCGAEATGTGDTCAHCGSPLLVIDLPRLAHALTVQSAAADAGPVPSGVPLAWPCRGCGSPLDPGTQTACPACGHGVVVPALVDVAPLLEHVEAQLQALPPRPAMQRRPRAERSYRNTSLWAAQGLFKNDGAADRPAAWRWIAAAALLGLIWLFTT